MDYRLKQFLSEIKDGKFKVTIKFSNYKLSQKVREDKRYDDLYKWFSRKYKKDGRGIKSILKDFKIPVSYSFLRNLIIFMGFELHSNIEANDFLKKRRSENARYQSLNKIGMFSEKIIGSSRNINYVVRGIQGYYWNNSKNKYVWLRSSREFIYAKWLNKNGIEWDVEVKKFKLKNNKLYLPDFFIFDNNKIKSIVEIKGYWKDKLYKFNELKEMLDVDLILITDISPYLENNLNKEIKIWKQLRKLELKK